jgi:hypothetical protein
MNQKEYRARKERKARLAEALALSPHAGPQFIQGGLVKGVVELSRDPGAPFVDPDRELPSRINAPMWGANGQAQPVAPAPNPINQFYGIPETEPEPDDDE